MHPGLRSGKLTKWKDERGFGFIQPVDGSQEVFLHISEVKDATRRPQENDTIYYHCVVDSDGKVRACNAFILGARNKSASLSTTSQKSERVLSSRILGDRDTSLHCMAILVALGKKAIGLALFHVFAVMPLIWLTIGDIEFYFYL